MGAGKVTPDQRRDQLLAAIPNQRQRDAVTGWLAERSATRTAQEYAADAMVFVRWLGPAPDLTTVTRLDVARFMAAQRDVVSPRTGRRLAPRTVRRRVAVVSAMLRHLSAVGLIDGNPASDVERPKAPQDASTPARPAGDIAALWDGTASREDVVIGLLYVSLMRVAELTSADVRGLITVDGSQVLRVRTKGGKSRDVALPDPIRVPLLEYVGDRRDGPLIVGPQGQRMTRSRIVRLLQRRARERGIPDPHLIRPHVFRASGITHLLDAEAPIHDVQHLAGHDTPATTIGYWRRSQARARDGALAHQLAENLVRERTPRG